MPNAFYSLLLHETVWGDYFEQAGFAAGDIIYFGGANSHFSLDGGTPLADNVYLLPPLPAAKAGVISTEPYPEPIPEFAPKLEFVSEPLKLRPDEPLAALPITLATAELPKVDMEIFYILLTQSTDRSELSLQNSPPSHSLPFGISVASDHHGLEHNFYAAWRLVNNVAPPTKINATIMLNIACLCIGDYLNFRGEAVLYIDLADSFGSLAFTDFGVDPIRKMSGFLEFSTPATEHLIIDNDALLNLTFADTKYEMNTKTMFFVSDKDIIDFRGTFYTFSGDPGMHIIAYFGSPCLKDSYSYDAGFSGCGAKN